MADIPSSLIDARARAKKNPRTFAVPTGLEINAMGIGDFLKIGLERSDGSGERFWVKLTSIEQDARFTTFTGVIDNDLQFFPELPCGTEISFRHEHVMQVLPANTH